MQTCPHCKSAIRLNELPHQEIFDSFRICPNCGGKFTVDTKTKYRQALLILIALGSLVLTVLMYYQGGKWLFPSIVSYVVLGLLLWWGNRLVFLVPDNKTEISDTDS